MMYEFKYDDEKKAWTWGIPGDGISIYLNDNHWAYSVNNEFLTSAGCRFGSFGKAKEQAIKDYERKK